MTKLGHGRNRKDGRCTALYHFGVKRWEVVQGGTGWYYTVRIGIRRYKGQPTQTAAVLRRHYRRVGTRAAGLNDLSIPIGPMGALVRACYASAGAGMRG